MNTLLPVDEDFFHARRRVRRVRSHARETQIMNIVETPSQKAQYLRTLPAVRQRCSEVFERAQDGTLSYFEFHPDKEAGVADFCVQLMMVFVTYLLCCTDSSST